MEKENEEKEESMIYDYFITVFLIFILSLSFGALIYMIIQLY